jgi:HSP20 family protein
MRIIRYHNSPIYSPARNFPALRDEMDRLFDVAFPALSSVLANEVNEFPIDLYRDKNSFVVRAELPGFRKEDLNVEVADGVLTVTGHQKAGESTAKEGADKTTPQERRVSRSIPLPEQVQVDHIQAQYENGVLTVTVPKQEEVKPRQVSIEVK